MFRWVQPFSELNVGIIQLYLLDVQSTFNFTTTKFILCRIFFILEIKWSLLNKTVNISVLGKLETTSS